MQDTAYIVLDTWWDEKPIRATGAVSVHLTEQAAEEALAYCYIEEATQMAQDEADDPGLDAITFYDALYEVVLDQDHAFHIETAPLFGAGGT